MTYVKQNKSLNWHFSNNIKLLPWIGSGQSLLPMANMAAMAMPVAVMHVGQFVGGIGGYLISQKSYKQWKDSYVRSAFNNEKGLKYSYVNSRVFRAPNLRVHTAKKTAYFLLSKSIRNGWSSIQFGYLAVKFLKTLKIIEWDKKRRKSNSVQSTISTRLLDWLMHQKKRAILGHF